MIACRKEGNYGKEKMIIYGSFILFYFISCHVKLYAIFSNVNHSYFISFYRKFFLKVSKNFK